MRLHVRFREHASERLIGVWTIVGSVLLGGGLIVPAVYEATVETRFGVNEGWVVAGSLLGGAILLVGVLVGISFASQSDAIDLMRGRVSF